MSTKTTGTRGRRFKALTMGGVAASVAFLSMLALGGCTPDARNDVSKAGADLDSAATKSAQGTEDAVKKADDKAAADAKAAGHEISADTKAVGKDIKNGADNAVQGTEKAVAKTGDAIANGANAAVQGTEKAAAKAGSAVSESTATISLTPKVKMAILKDDSVKIPDLNIDTHSDSKEVVVNGTAPTAAEKTKAMADAKTALANDTSGYKLVDNLKVASAK